MFKMKQEDMLALIERRKWGTLCTVSDDGTPYAIEFSYFLIDGDICGMINPHGTTSRNIERDQRVLFKICESDDNCRAYQAVSVYGTAEYVQDRAVVSQAWDELERQLGLEAGTYGKFKAKFSDPALKSPLFRLRADRLTGRANWSEKDTGGED